MWQGVILVASQILWQEELQCVILLTLKYALSICMARSVPYTVLIKQRFKEKHNNTVVAFKQGSKRFHEEWIGFCGNWISD